MNSRFELTAEHIKLLRRAYIGWQDCETGAPEIDPSDHMGIATLAEMSLTYSVSRESAVHIATDC